MQHFNKNNFIGNSVWNAICSLTTKEQRYSSSFEYKAEGKKILCEVYSNNQFAIRYLP